MDANNGQPPMMSNADLWKEQIRRALEESQSRNVNAGASYRANLTAPNETRSYYDRLKDGEYMRLRMLREKAKSESELLKKRRAQFAKWNDKGVTNAYHKTPGTHTGGPNVAPTDYSAWPRHHPNHPDHPHHVKRKSHARASDDKHGEHGHDAHHIMEELPPDLQISEVTLQTGDETGDEILSYFDPNFVKSEFKTLLTKSRNIAVGPPKEILRQYFDYAENDPIPSELENDDSPKAFILPKRFWKEFDDLPKHDKGQSRPTPGIFQKESTRLSRQSDKEKEVEKREEPGIFVPDNDILNRMRSENETKPFIPRQPRDYAVDYLARQPFKKFGMTGTNLQDASPNVLEHWEMKPVNADPGGHLRREATDKRFKISKVTGIPVKVSRKEAKLGDDERPWYYEGMADDEDPKDLGKSPAFKGGLLDNKRFGGKRFPKDGDGDDDGKGRSKRRKGKGSPTSSDGSEGSSGSGSYCSCADYSSSSSGSGGSDANAGEIEGVEEGDIEGERPKSKGKRRKNKTPVEGRDEEEAEAGKDEEPVTKKSSKKKGKRDLDETVPDWAPELWKSPKGYKQWIYTDKSQPPPAADKIKETKEWMDAFQVVKREMQTRESTGGEDNELRVLFQDAGGILTTDDEYFLEDEEWEGEGEEEYDPMQRLDREGLETDEATDLSSKPSHRRYPEYPQSPQFQYYKSYPLYPTISSERYFEWYKDVHRLENPNAQKAYLRPLGYSKSLNNINWDDPKEAARWYAQGYRRPDPRPKPTRADYDTKDYIYDNARSIMLMPPRKVVPKYIDDRKGTSHFLEPSGLIQKFVLRNEFGKVPDYLVERNQELGRPPLPDLDKFYRPHRCKYMHGHVHCKICMRAHPVIHQRKIGWHCEMTPNDYEEAMEYRKRKGSLHSKSTSYSGSYPEDSKVQIVGMSSRYNGWTSGEASRNNGTEQQNFNAVQRLISDKNTAVNPHIYV